MRLTKKLHIGGNPDDPASCHSISYRLHLVGASIEPHGVGPYPAGRPNTPKSQNQQIAQLQTQIETLQGRVEKTSPTSSKPPSSDAPFNTPKRQRKQSAGKRGGQKGHRGNGPHCLGPLRSLSLCPAPVPVAMASCIPAPVPHSSSDCTATDRDGHPPLLCSSRASARDVADSSKPRCQVHIRPAMARA